MDTPAPIRNLQDSIQRAHERALQTGPVLAVRDGWLVEVQLDSAGQEQVTRIRPVEPGKPVRPGTRIHIPPKDGTE